MFVVLISLLTILLTQLAHADDNAETHLEKIIVQAPKSSSTTTGSYTRFFREDFHGKYNSLSEFLQQNASIQVRHNGIGNSVELSVRGSSHDQIQFVVDGQLIQNAQYGGFDIDQIPLSHIESIELVKGHHSTSNQQAIGGLIKITRSSSFSSNNELSLSAGQFGQKQISSSHAIPFYGNLFLGVDIKKADNDYTTNITSPINNHNNRNAVHALNNNHLETYYGRLQWNSKQYSHGLFTLGFESKRKEKAIPNYFHNSSDNNALYKKNYDSLNFRYSLLTKYDTELSSHFYYQSNDDRYTDIDQGVALSPQDIQYDHNQIQFKQDIQHQYGLHQLHLNLSLDQQNYRDNYLLTPDHLKCNSLFSDCDIQSKREMTKVSLKDIWGIRKTLSISAQVGLTQTNYQAKEAQSGIVSKNNSINSKQWGLNFNKGFHEDIEAQISINKADRLPTLFELYGNLGAMKGSPSLQAEEAINISLDLQSKQSGLFSLSIYHRDMINSIISTYNSQGIGSYDNAQSAKIYGIEFSSKKQFKKLLFEGFASLKNSLTESNIKSFDNNKLPGIYHENYSIGISYQINNRHILKWHSFLDKDIYLDSSNLNRSSDRKLSNLKYLYSKSDLSIQIAINNILNASYFDTSNHQAAGRNINMQLTYSY